MTLEQAQANLELWIAASVAVAGGQEYEIATGNGGSRRLRRVDSKEIRNWITHWENQITRLTRVAQRRSGVRYFVQ